ncbi:MAG: pyridoxamine 5'-phosphate oxidase [Phycisphaerae bacterium]|jgi:pyridoxamine 5'-phosphate oxidase|nr:pyridoxamine 5'-phosphate oxidase [Phycisphaerae bacterium]
MNFNSPPNSPVQSMQEWFDEAHELRPTPNPLATTLSTVSADGIPSSRMVLLKGFNEHGAVFYTNYESEKANDMKENDAVSLLFHWDDLQRQVRIQGRAEKISAEESDTYFASRAKLSQAGAWASAQSQPLKNRAVLMAKVTALTAKWIGRNIPRPEHWGGFRVSLDTVELWQGHDGRLHDRIRYTCTDGSWDWVRLQP